MSHCTHWKFNKQYKFSRIKLLMNIALINSILPSILKYEIKKNVVSDVNFEIKDKILVLKRLIFLLVQRFFSSKSWLLKKYNNCFELSFESYIKYS